MAPATQQQPSEQQQSKGSSEATTSKNHQDPNPQEDPEECGWCRWMKGGGCKEQFEVWLKCVDEVRDAGRQDVETCASVMGPLWECMEKNADYYSAQLDALKGRSAESKGSKGNDGLEEVVEGLGDELEEFVEGFMDDDDVGGDAGADDS